MGSEHSISSDDGSSAIGAIEPEVRRLLARAGIDTDCPEQVVRGMLMVTAAAIVRLARAEDLDITEAARVAQMAGMQLPRLVLQMGSRGVRGSRGRCGVAV